MLVAAGVRNICLLKAEGAEGMHARNTPVGKENSAENLIKELLDTRTGLAYRFTKLNASGALPLGCLEAR